MNFLYFLESLRNPFTDGLMSFITFMGDELVFMTISLLMFWCIDKYKGYLILSIGFAGTVINQFLKLAFHIPRPWIKDPAFTIVESAREGASGYSFPSGHTQNAVGTYGAIALTSKKNAVRLPAILLLILVPFSRMYLGVHTPLDVSVSFLIAALLIAIFIPLTDCAKKHPNVMFYILAAMFLAALAFVLCVELYRFPGATDPSNFASGRKNAYTLLGAVTGMCIAFPIEKKYVNFSTKSVWWAQIIKLAGGLAITIALKEILKTVFNLIFGEGFIFAHTIRYALVIIFVALVWPLTFKFFSRLGKKE